LQKQLDYEYNAFGLKMEQVIDADGSGAGSAVTMRFAYEGWNAARRGGIGRENFDVLADLDANSSLTTHYVRGDRVDELIARADGSSPRWYLNDRLGSVRDIIDSSVVLKDSLKYSGFGVITSETTPAERGRYTWTSREYEAETELQYNRARWYDPKMGKWLSQDPLGFGAGDSNLYRYVNNGPASTTDPSGLVDIEVEHNRTTWFGKAIAGKKELAFKVDGKSGHSITLEFQDAWEAQSGIKVTYRGPEARNIKIFQTFKMSIRAYFANGKSGFIEGGFPIRPENDVVAAGYFGFDGPGSVNGRESILDAPTKLNSWRYYSESRNPKLSGRGKDFVFIQDRPSVQDGIFSESLFGGARIGLGTALAKSKATNATSNVNFTTYIELSGELIAVAKWSAYGSWTPGTVYGANIKDLGFQLDDLYVAKSLSKKGTLRERAWEKSDHEMVKDWKASEWKDVPLFLDQLEKIRGD
jgi:RHS repeat-associated protein